LTKIAVVKTTDWNGVSGVFPVKNWKISRIQSKQNIVKVVFVNSAGDVESKTVRMSDMTFGGVSE